MRRLLAVLVLVALGVAAWRAFPALLPGAPSARPAPDAAVGTARRAPSVVEVAPAQDGGRAASSPSSGEAARGARHPLDVGPAPEPGRPGTLRGVTLSADGTALPNIAVRLSGLPHLDGGADSLRQTTDAAGAFAFDAVPPSIVLTLALARDAVPLSKLDRELVLEPGEERELVLYVGAGARIEGTVTDTAGAAVGKLTLHLVRQEGSTPARYLDRGARLGFATTRTDADGRFAFEDVPAGWWLVGPAAREDPSAREAAPLGIPIEITAGERVRELPLTVYRDLFLRGTVVAPDGRPAQVLVVVASEAFGTTSGNSDPDGSFALGPLAPGAVWANAEAYAAAPYFGERSDSGPDLQDLAPSERVAAFAGSAGVLLRLRPGAQVVGTVIDEATQRPIAAQLHLTPLARQSRSRSDGSDGTFELTKLAPGPWGLVATTADGLACTTILDLALGQRLETQLAVRSGVSLDIIRPGTARRFEVEQHGLHVASGDFPGPSAHACTPPGAITVRALARSGAVLAETVVHGSPGEVLTARF